MHPYSKSAPKTNIIQEIIHAEIEVKDFVLGECEVTLMKMFIRTKNKVMSKVIRPGTTSGGITKLTCNKKEKK